MADLLSLRFAKTPGTVSLPDGISRQYKVYSGGRPPDGEADLIFDLVKSHMRGDTLVRRRGEWDLKIECLSGIGSGRWRLATQEGDSLCEISGRGAFSEGWKMRCAGEVAPFELVNPEHLGRKIARTMLGSATEGPAAVKPWAL